MKETVTFTIIDRSKISAPYKTQVKATDSGDAIRYFFKLEGIETPPVMPRFQKQNLRYEFDARYAVLNEKTGRIFLYNIDGQALDMDKMMLYTVDRVYKLKKTGRIR